METAASLLSDTSSFSTTISGKSTVAGKTVIVTPLYTLEATTTVTGTAAPTSTEGCSIFKTVMTAADGNGPVTADTACESTATASGRRLEGRRLETSSFDVTATLELPLNATDESALNETLAAANAAKSTLSGLTTS